MKIIYLIYMLCVVIYNSNIVSAKDLFASLGEMTKLVETGEKISIHLEQILEDQNNVIRQATKILNGFEEIKQHSKLDPQKFIGNPINSFLLIKQLSKDLQNFIDVLNNYDRLKDAVYFIKESFLLPTDDDYRGAIDAIHRLEDTYLLEPRDIRTGNLSKLYPSRKLTAFECFEIGRIAYDKEDFYHTVIWMIEALEQHKLEANSPTADIVLILDYLAFATSQQGNLKHAIELTNELLAIDPSHQRAASNLLIYKKNLEQNLKLLKGDKNLSDTPRNPNDFVNPRIEGTEKYNYEHLCRTEDPKVTSQLRQLKIKLFVKRSLYLTKKALDSNLKCRYINHNPMLILAPAKEEQVHSNPDIWVYHDVITNKQIDLLKEMATPRLKRAIVRNPVTGIFETADYRISKSSWISDNENQDLTHLTKYVESITNLSLSTAEEWQVANYGIAGQYDPHYDFARKSDSGQFEHSIGNRVATWMYYLEAPEKGGATVFTTIGARIKPIRGSAVFWYNLLPSGDGDMRTRHAACPVLYGSKWVANKWIHLRGQELNRPCNLIKEETEDV